MKRCLILLLAAGATAQAGAVLSTSPSSTPLLHLRAITFDPAAPQARALSLSFPTAYQIVQCNGPIQPGWRASLESAGAHLFDYLPDHAFISRLDPAAAAAVSRLPFVRAVTPY